MKTILTLLTVFFVALCLPAQVQYGTIDYLRSTEEASKTSKIEGISDLEQKKIQAMMDQMRAAGGFNEKYQATFTPGGFSLIEQTEQFTSEEKELAGGITIRMESGGGDPKAYYTDVTSGEIVNSQSITDLRFLVSGTVLPLEWTMTGESVPPSEMTVGLDLKLATAVNARGDTVTAGYAPSLPVQVGPENYYGLPGAIITLRIPRPSGDVTVYRATSLSLSPEPLTLEKPTLGKEITLEKFRKEQEKRQKLTTKTRNSSRFGGE